MKLICDTLSICTVYDAPAIPVGGTVNTGEMDGLASLQRYGKPIGRCSSTERCTGFDLGNYVIEISLPRLVRSLFTCERFNNT
jgi:hypothetical protein